MFRAVGEELASSSRKAAKCNVLAPQARSLLGRIAPGYTCTMEGGCERVLRQAWQAWRREKGDVHLRRSIGAASERCSFHRGGLSLSYPARWWRLGAGIIGVEDGECSLERLVDAVDLIAKPL